MKWWQVNAIPALERTTGKDAVIPFTVWRDGVKPCEMVRVDPFGRLRGPAEPGPRQNLRSFPVAASRPGGASLPLCGSFRTLGGERNGEYERPA